LKSCCVLQDHQDDERDKIVFNNTTRNPERVQDQDKDQDRWTKTKSDGLRPHHLSVYDVNTQ